MSGGGWSFGVSRSFLEPPAGAPYQYFELDDGWWIDDIVLTDLRELPSVIGPDTQRDGSPSTGMATCNIPSVPGYDSTLNCGTISVDVAGSTAGGPGRIVELDSLAQIVLLDARQTVAVAGGGGGACENGVLQYQWTKISPAPVEVVQSFSPEASLSVAPSADTTYRLEVQCSSDTACAASEDILVQVYTGDGSDLNPEGDVAGLGLDVTGGSVATISWATRPQPSGISGYDVFRYDTTGGLTGADVFSSGDFDGVCLADGVAPGVTDPALPAVNETFMYQVSHSSNNSAAINPLGTRPSSSSRAGQLVMAGTSCP
jgi:hypothetical protein